MNPRVTEFRRLHEAGCFVLPNPWDIGSARLLVGLGFKAVATTSAGLAWSLGRRDNEISVELSLSHLRAIAAAVEVPVNADFEDGFARDPLGVAANVWAAVETGIAGVSIEDSTGDGATPLYDFTLAVERIKAARKAIDDSGTGVLLTGRSEGFISGRPDLAEKSAYVTMRYSLAFMASLALVMMLLGRQITGLFVGGEHASEVEDIGRKLLFIFAFAMPALAVSLTLGGALRGAGDTRAVLAIMAGCTWLIRLIPAYLMAITLGWGVPGAWVAAILDINTRALLMFLRFRLGRWKTIRV